jgi:DNA-binding transcriptional LysR family regulator
MSSEGDDHVESGDLRIFQAVAHEGSVTKAAGKLGYVQSNVTARIQQLESELGTPLFYRTKKGMKLTTAGENLLGYTDRILSLLDEAVKSTQFSAEPKGPLRLGALETIAAVNLPKLLLHFHRNYPEVKPSLITGHTEDLLQKVLQYKLDGAFVSRRVEHPDVEQFLVFEDELVLISEAGDADRRELLNKPLLFFGAGCSHRKRLEDWLREEGINPPNIMEFGTLEAILGGVTAGLGVSLMPRSAVSKLESEGKLRIHRIPPRYQQTDVVFVYRKDVFLTSAFRKFVELLRDQLRGIRAMS